MNRKTSLFLKISFLSLFVILYPSDTKLSATESCTYNNQEGIISPATGDCIPPLTISSTPCTTSDTNQAGTYDSSGKCVATNTTSPATTSTTTGNKGLIPCGHGSDPADACTLCDFIVGFQNLINFALKILVTIAVVGIFISGVMYIISSGSEQMITKAKTFLTSSLIGFTVVLAGWLIVNIVMWSLSFNDTIGISVGKENWYTFDCD